jgi:hypothetical protein
MSTTLEATVTLETKWELFPFTYLGRSYNSKVSPTNSNYSTIKSLPAGAFSTINAAALRDISTITEASTVEEITAELERLNAGSSWAILELAGE